MGLETIAPINEAENLAKVTAGMTGGPFFQKMNMPPPMNIVNGVPSEVTAKLQSAEPTPTGKPLDSWNQRR